MVITRNARPVAILTAVNESRLEESLAAFRQARAIDAVAALPCRAVACGVDALSSGEIEAEIEAVRTGRTR